MNMWKCKRSVYFQMVHLLHFSYDIGRHPYGSLYYPLSTSLYHICTCFAGLLQCGPNSAWHYSAKWAKETRGGLVSGLFIGVPNSLNNHVVHGMVHNIAFPPLLLWKPNKTPLKSSILNALKPPQDWQKKPGVGSFGVANRAQWWCFDTELVE